MKVIRIRKPSRNAVRNALSAVNTDYFSSAGRYRLERILKEYPENRDAVLYLVQENARTLDLAFLVFLRWDTGIFGSRMGRIEFPCEAPELKARSLILKNIVADSIKEKYRQLSCRIGSEDFASLHLLIKEGFFPMDSQITLFAKAPFSGIASRENRCFKVRAASENDLVYLKEISSGAFTDTRFVNDPVFSNEKVDKLYREWVKNSVLDPERRVFIITKRKERSPIGFCITKEDLLARKILGKKAATIELVAVKRSERGRGVGKALIGAVLQRLGKRDDYVEIRTQVANHAAVNAFMAAGLKRFTEGIMLPCGVTLHRWR